MNHQVLPTHHITPPKLDSYEHSMAQLPDMRARTEPTGSEGLQLLTRHRDIMGFCRAIVKLNGKIDVI